MLKRLAPLVPMSFVLLLAACASHSPEPQVAKEPTAAKSSIDVERDAIAWQDVEDEGADNSSAGTPALASSILERFRTDRYAVPFRRYDGERLRLQRLRRLPVPRGGRHQAAALHPRTHRYGRTAGLQDELQPGDLLFFNNQAVVASATPASTSAMASSSIPPAVAAAGAGGQPGLQLLEPELHGSQAGARTRLQGCPDEQALNLKFYFKYCV